MKNKDELCAGARRRVRAVGVALSLLGLFTLTAAETCYRQNGWCEVNGSTSATRAYSDSARTTKAWIYCQSGGAANQACNTCGSYDGIWYKENSTYGSCSEATGWVNGGSAGPTNKKCNDFDCSS